MNIFTVVLVSVSELLHHYYIHFIMFPYAVPRTQNSYKGAFREAFLPTTAVLSCYFYTRDLPLIFKKPGRCPPASLIKKVFSSTRLRLTRRLFVYRTILRKLRTWQCVKIPRTAAVSEMLKLPRLAATVITQR